MSSFFLKTVISGFSKGGSAFVAFFLTALVTRSLGANDAGLFLLGFSFVAALSVFFRLGLDNIVLRSVGAEGTSMAAQLILNRGLLWILCITLPISLLLSLFSEAIAVNAFNKPDFTTVIRWMVLAVPFMALFTLLAMAFQGLHRIFFATFFMNLGLSTFFVIVLALVWWFCPLCLSADIAAAIYLFCAAAILILALVLWFQQKSVQFQIIGFKDAKLWKACSNLWVVASMSLLVQWSGMLVAGALVATNELAYFSAAQRTAQLASFVLMVVNMVVAPRYARLWVEDDLPEIRRLARLSTRGMIALVLPVVGGMMLFPELIMNLFGAGFEQGAVLLMIMALGQLINVATGSVGYLLTMSGHEVDLRKVTLFSGPLTIFCAVLFTWQWGVIGAAWATAVGLAAQNVGALWMVKKRLGFWPVG